jgi:predicted nicotinamide N-methyase
MDTPVVAWREFNIYDAYATADQVEEGEEDESRDFLFRMFESTQQDTNEVLEFHFPSIPSIFLEAQQDYTNSTGLSLWGGSEALCHYLIEHPDLIVGKSVLELGAGVGLCGIVAHHLGASQVILTDGDAQVLTKLRHNVKRNIRNDNNTTSCPQLIWGRNLDYLVQAYGQQDVILGSDLVYMTQSLEPLWQTVDKLLERNGFFLYVNLCASQAPVEVVLDKAKQYGFNWMTSSSAICSTKGVVYMFRRQNV